jgi:hypothetical protein
MQSLAMQYSAGQYRVAWCDAGWCGAMQGSVGQCGMVWGDAGGAGRCGAMRGGAGWHGAMQGGAAKIRGDFNMREIFVEVWGAWGMPRCSRLQSLGGVICRNGVKEVGNEDKRSAQQKQDLTRH